MGEPTNLQELRQLYGAGIEAMTGGRPTHRVFRRAVRKFDEIVGEHVHDVELAAWAEGFAAGAAGRRYEGSA